MPNNGSVTESDIKREQEEFLKALTNNQARREVLDLYNNALTTRRDLARSLLDPRRNINDECGFPETDAITDQDYRELYDREAVATRVIELLPDESWKVQPRVFETDDPSEETAFELALMELNKSLSGEESWFESEDSNCLWEYLRRADVMSGVGSYGVLLIGLSDGKELDQPAGKREGQQITFLNVFDRSLVSVSEWDQDKTSRRFNKPLAYDIKLNDPNEDTSDNVQRSESVVTHRVHWTRVIHIPSDGIRSSDIIGTPRLRPVYNNVYGLRKLYAGSPEMYWKGAFPGYSLKADKDIALAGMLPDRAAIRDEMEQIMNGLQRYFGMLGLSLESLAPQVVDPTPQIKVQIEAICIKLACPVRKFVGSERGELASSQDEEDWNDTIRGRQENHVTPRIIVPFINRCIQLGVLPTPKSYGIDWPDISKIDGEKNATIASRIIETMVKYVSGGADQIMSPMDFLTKVLDFTDEEAESILEAALEATEEKIEQQLERQEELGLPAPGQQIPGQEGGLPPEEGGELPPDQQPVEEEDEEETTSDEDEEEEIVIGNKGVIVLHHTPGGQEHDQQKHGRKGGGGKRKYTPPDKKFFDDLKASNTDKISKEHAESLSLYTTGVANLVNKKVKKGVEPKALKDPVLRKVFTDMTSAIEKAPPLPKGTTVFRGVFGQGEKLQKRLGRFKTGETVSMKGLISTSLDPKVAFDFTEADEVGGGFMLQISNPKKGLYVDGKGAFPKENEMVLKHGANYKVLGRGKVTAKGTSIPLIRLEEI